MRSMTGYGRGLAESEEHRVTVEMRAVNHRFLDLKLRGGDVGPDIEHLVTKAVVDVDPARARRARVDNVEIANSLRAILSGDTPTMLREGDEEIPITGRAVPAERLAADRLLTANVFSRRDGGAVPL